MKSSKTRKTKRTKRISPRVCLKKSKPS